MATQAPFWIKKKKSSENTVVSKLRKLCLNSVVCKPMPSSLSVSSVNHQARVFSRPTYCCYVSSITFWVSPHTWSMHCPVSKSSSVSMFVSLTWKSTREKLTQTCCQPRHCAEFSLQSSLALQASFFVCLFICLFCFVFFIQVVLETLLHKPIKIVVYVAWDKNICWLI